MDSILAVVVTGVGSGGLGEQIVKALRMAVTAYTIIGTDVSAGRLGAADVDERHVVPPAGDPSYVDELLGICHRHGARVLFYGSEPELQTLSRQTARLHDAGLFFTANPPGLIDLCMDKVRAGAELHQLGFAAPRFRRVRSHADLGDVPFLPAVLKPSTRTSGSANVFLAQSAAELAAFGDHLLGLYPEFVVQEYVGLPENEYTVGVLACPDGAILNSIAVRRDLGSKLSTRIRVPNQTQRDELGPQLVISSGVSQGEIGRFPDVTGPCEEIAKSLGVRSPINIQCRIVDGKVLPFEINPRFSATTSVRALVGFNEPDVLIRRELLGEEIPSHFPYGSGIVTRCLVETLLPLPEHV